MLLHIPGLWVCLCFSGPPASQCVAPEDNVINVDDDEQDEEEDERDEGGEGEEGQEEEEGAGGEALLPRAGARQQGCQGAGGE